MTWARLQLPGPLGGCGCRIPSGESSAAFLSTWLSTSHKVVAISAELKLPTSGVLVQNEATIARSELLAAGVDVSLAGRVVFTEGVRTRYCGSAWAGEMPVEHLLNTTHSKNSSQEVGCRLHGRMLRGLEAIKAMDVFEQNDFYGRTLMLSAGGPGSGKFFTMFPIASKYYMPDTHFRTSLLARLGLICPPDGAVCQIPEGPMDAPHACGCRLERPFVHPYLCKAGPSRLRPHRSLCNAMAYECRAAGGHVDLERACPQLYKWHGDRCQEAILDVVYHLPGTTVTRNIDITVRCPFATRYVNTDSKVAVAALSGENEKVARYGSEVSPISFETFGRLGPQSMVNLQNVAADFVRPGGRRSCMGVYNRLRYILEYMLLYENADLILMSLGASSGLLGWQQQRRASGR